MFQADKEDYVIQLFQHHTLCILLVSVIRKKVPLESGGTRCCSNGS